MFWYLIFLLLTIWALVVVEAARTLIERIRRAEGELG